MPSTQSCLVPARVSVIGLAVFIAGCGGSVNLWPFGESRSPERSRTPENATEYRCADGRAFYVRTLDGGAAVWLILPDRQVRLERSSAGYSNGIATLRAEGGTATLTDGNAAWGNCQTPAAGKP